MWVCRAPEYDAWLPVGGWQKCRGYCCHIQSHHETDWRISWQICECFSKMSQQRFYYFPLGSLQRRAPASVSWPSRGKRATRLWPDHLQDVHLQKVFGNQTSSKQSCCQGGVRLLNQFLSMVICINFIFSNKLFKLNKKYHSICWHCLWGHRQNFST